MVFFTCSHCGESVKKPSVSKHYETKCRNREPFLTCVDCLKDFKGAEYEAHTKCVTEDEKYSAKGYVPKPSQNKGERKQQAWQECIQTALKKPTLKQDERDLIKVISKYENVPRKKAKFINFLSNAFRQYAHKNDLIDRVWTEMESVFKEVSASEKQQQEKEKKSDQENETQSEAKKSPEEAEENGMKKEKKRKRKAEENKVVEAADSGSGNEKSKKKKTKHSEENVAEDNNDLSATNGTGDQQEKKSRKRKAGESGVVEQNGVAGDDSESGKKKKKKKHDKLAENQINENPEQPTESVSKNKKKHKKSKNGAAEEDSGEGKMPPVDASDAKSGKKEKKSENKENRLEKAEKPSSEGDAKTEKPVSKKKKSGGEGDKQETFDWKATILQVLNKDGKDNKIQIQKLQKKVLKLHCQILKCENSGKKEKKFMKKLREIPGIQINDDFVVLQS